MDKTERFIKDDFFKRRLNLDNLRIMTNENDTNLLDKINFFLSEKIKVHVEKKDKLFLNGYFIKLVKDNVWSFNDDKFKEVYLFLSDIYNIEKFREAEK